MTTENLAGYLHERCLEVDWKLCKFLIDLIGVRNFCLNITEIETIGLCYSSLNTQKSIYWFKINIVTNFENDCFQQNFN